VALSAAQERKVKRAEERLRKRKLFTAEQICHPGQLRMARDRSRNVTVEAGRQSGKTFECVRGDLDDAMADVAQLLKRTGETEGVAFVYVSSTRPSVKKMYWRPLRALVNKYALPFRLNSSDLTAECKETGSIIYCLSADDEKTADRLRGIPRLYRVRVDECQRYDSDNLRYLVEDVIRPGLRPLAGCLWLLRTGMSPRGFAWEASQNPAYSHHHFTYRDNTKLGQTAEEIEAVVEEDLKAAKRTRDSAWFKREYLAEDVDEIAERAYRFVEAKHTYRELPDNLDTVVICGDTGVDDADALGRLEWCSSGPRKVYLTKEHVMRGQDVDQFDGKLKEWMAEIEAEGKELILVTIDAGANAKTVLTVQNRHPDVPITPAKKPTVNQQIDELNSFLDELILAVPAESTFAQEVIRPTWVDGIVHGKLKENGHSDIVPGVRYGALAIRPLLPDPPSAPKLDEEARKEAIRARIQKQLRKRKRPQWDTANPVAEEDLSEEASALLGEGEF